MSSFNSRSDMCQNFFAYGRHGIMKNNITALLPEIMEIRRTLHRFPELSFREIKTTELIRRKLKSWGLEFVPFKHLDTGGYCDVGAGPAIALRSDIDALPIKENPRHEIISRIPGQMHACGHDFHTAVGLGLLKYFAENKEDLPGRLRVIFQPGEEAAPGGAESVVKENIWESVKSIITVHVAPGVQSGKFILHMGPVQASSTSVRINISGPGGHTSKPFKTIDLINVCGFYITQLQSHLAKKTDARDTVAFAFGAVNGGSTHNIIPQRVELRGTIRTLDNQVLADSQNLIRKFSASFANIYGAQINVQFPTTCPATINDRQLAEKFLAFMQVNDKEENLLLPPKPSMGADDFSFYLEKVPGLYLGIGAGGRGVLHSGDLLLDENLLEPAIENMAGFISFLFEG